MASPSSLRPHKYSYNVFSSFHGPDVHKTLLSHIREQFNRNGITMFDDQKIVRGATIAPSLKEAIKESRIAIVVLSKKYASSSWCLDELVEILECKKAFGQIVMTIFYCVDPSDVRKQIGEFGVAFDETCAHKTDEERQKWSKALKEVGNIAGEDFLRWDNEANMIKKIAKDISDKLNATPSRDFDGMVGLEAHLRKMESLLDLDYDGVKIVAITGPAGIGKTTIARALQSRVSNRFQLTCFVDNLRGSYLRGLDALRLHEQLLSKVLNHDGIRISHSGVIEERLWKHRVLIILDDVNNIQQLMALANETTWFGPGSRIVITTENKELLQQHGINNIYNVRFPSFHEAVKILCRYAFKHTSPRHGFNELADSVTELCGKLPLGLRVVGSSLQGKRHRNARSCWMLMIFVMYLKMPKKVVGISFDISGISEVSISKKAFKRMSNLRFLRVYKSKDGGNYKMHIPGDVEFPRRLLRLLDWKAYPSKSFPSTFHAENLVQLDMQGSKLEYLWHRTQPLNNLKDMDLSESIHLKEVPDLSNATNLEKLFLSSCESLKKVPDLSNATNLKNLNLSHCKSLVEIPSSCSYLQKLTTLDVNGCINLQVIPADMNLASLELVYMGGCSRLRNIPVMSTNIKYLLITNTAVEDVPPSIRICSNLEYLDIRGSGKLKRLTHLPTSVQDLHLNSTDIERIPECIKELHELKALSLSGCKRLASLPELPDSLKYLDADDCESLETVYCPFNTAIERLSFTNCFKLGKQARRAIIQQPFFRGYAVLPGRKVPAEFNHRAIGNSLTIHLNGNPLHGIVFCVVLSPHHRVTEINSVSYLSWRRIIAQDDGYPVEGCVPVGTASKFRTEHLFIFNSGSLELYTPENSREILVELSSDYHDFDIVECGAKILNEESIKASYESGLDQVIEDDDIEFEPSEAVEDEIYGDCCIL